MSASLLSSRHARIILGLTLAGGALLTAACDTDQPVAPSTTPTAVAAKPNPSVSPANGGDMVLKVIDPNKKVIGALPAGGFTITGPNQQAWLAWDNGPYDSDATVGVVVFKSLGTGLYKVCETNPPASLGVVGASCASVTVYAGATSGAYFTNMPATHLKFTVKDSAQTLLGGSIFTLDSNNVLISNSIVDNNKPDVDLTSGKFDFPIRFEATYKVCAAMAPFSYMWVPNQPLCVTKAIKMGMGDIDLGTFAVVKQYSGSWKVTDGTFDVNNQPTLIGPSTFTISFPGGGTANAVDNGNADEDPTLGKIAVTFPFPGNYTICETVPPANHWNAQPACKQFTVTAGVPVNLGVFTNYEKQVFRP